MRREALRSAQVVLKMRRKKLIDASDIDSARLVAAVTKVKDSLPSRRGEIYQVCLMVLRAAKVPEEQSADASSTSKKRQQPESSASGSVAKKQAAGASMSKGS